MYGARSKHTLRDVNQIYKLKMCSIHVTNKRTKHAKKETKRNKANT